MDVVVFLHCQPPCGSRGRGINEQQRLPPSLLVSRFDPMYADNCVASIHIRHHTHIQGAPAPHDANLGLWREVELTVMPPSTPAITIRYPQVATTLFPSHNANSGSSSDHSSDSSSSRATFEIMAEIQNWGEHDIKDGIICAQLGGSGGEAGSDIAINDGYRGSSSSSSSSTTTSRIVATTAARVPTIPADGSAIQVVLNVSAPVSDADLWWPQQMGAATLHNLTFIFVASNKGADGMAVPPSCPQYGAKSTASKIPAPPAATATFLVGLREVSAVNDANNNLVLRVNKKRILVRGTDGPL